MAGFLDSFFGSPEQTQALGLLGASLMKGKGADGFLLANQYMAEAPERRLKKQYMDMQIQNMQSEMEARRIATEQAKRKQEILHSILGATGQPSQPASMGQLGSGSFGIVQPPEGQPAIPQSSPRVPNLSFDQLAALKMYGVDLVDLHKYANDPRKMESGSTYENRLTGQREYFPRLPEGMAQGAGGRYGFVPGYADSVADLEGRKARATEGARADLDPVEVVAPDGSKRFVPRSAVTRPQGLTQGGDADRFAILTQELQKAQAAGRTADVQAIQNEISRLPASARSTPSPSGLSVAGFQSAPSTAQTLSREAGGKINDSWLKTSYEPTLASGGTARDLLETVQVTRQAMRSMGGTGWSTQAKAAGAAILTGLGLAPKNAEMFAANAEVFQKTAMERLWTTLNEAKGPQTEGDADRASKTYASLRNTTKANEFILDFAEAKAQRDQIKAKFYQQALPIARDKGDLSEVDREWSKLAPSIFTMPSLQKWAGGVK